MRSFLIRGVSLYVFNVAVLLVIGMLLPTVNVGLSALWGAVVLTLATIIIKPLLTRIFTRTGARAAGSGGEKSAQYLVVFGVELAVWIIVVIFSGVRVGGFFWGYLLPPLMLLLAWIIYDQVDDRIQRKTGEVYDSLRGRTRNNDN